MHPDFTVSIRNHDFRGAGGIIPVLLHKEITANSQLTLLANRKDSGLISRVNDFSLDMWHEAADGIDAFIDGVVGRCHSRDGRCLCHAVADSQLGEVEHGVELFHEFRGDAASGCDAGAEVFVA